MDLPEIDSYVAEIPLVALPLAVFFLSLAPPEAALLVKQSGLHVLVLRLF